MKLLQALLISAITFPVYAHGPTPQKTDQAVLFNVPPATVWKALSEPCAILNWHPQVAECKAEGQLKRTLTLKNGGKITEEVDELLPGEMSISYRLGSDSEVKALSVSSLTGRIKVKAEGDNANVVWIARYYRADTTNEPPAGMDDAAAQLSVNSYVREGLIGLEGYLVKK
ncbi:MAG: SRPBCC family protein [Betaproteobacteria bacterium HGW-Betaproteobacteria-2]|nr:MAG: SRPBCC family protein [Betaproteobacteria bacterium HGW-Betaproteobacteria-2]